MKILLLADPASSHTIKWANSLSEKGLDIYIIGLSNFNPKLFNERIKIESLNISQRFKTKTSGSFSKIVYLYAIKKIIKIIKIFKPDILHAHYASSYGLLGSLTGFHPFIISVWGSDIYNFPQKSFIHCKIVRFNLSKADVILSTSNAMSKQTKKFTDKKIIVTPFGIDTDKFKPKKSTSIFVASDFVIGTIKTLEKNYGIEYLIKAFKIVKEKQSVKILKLMIVGTGTQQTYLKSLVNELNLKNDTVFTGYIDHQKIPNYQNMLDVAVIPSINESFGVTALEASACGKPVIASNVGGLLEVIEDGVTGYLVEKQNPQAIADALEKLINNEDLRKELGTNGRNKVIKEYNWEVCVEKMISVYKTLK
jgi:glycosyltransferase involved in cell wall biosynthesis